MTYADIIIMLKAGYTKDEIEAMDEPEQTQSAEPETQQAAPAQEAPAEEPAQEAQPAAPAEAPADPTQQILQQLTELVKSVQAQNRGAAEIRGNIIEPGAQAMDTLMSLGGIQAAPENK